MRILPLPGFAAFFSALTKFCLAHDHIRKIESGMLNQINMIINDLFEARVSGPFTIKHNGKKIFFSDVSVK